MTATIDVIVPVYRGLDETQRCLESIWKSESQQPYRLIVINDCSPEPELREWLRTVSNRQPMLLLENTVNLGFVGTANRGMALSSSTDVILLNSDTEVFHDWIDRLHAAAHSAPDIGTVTPFSNNATICSYPILCQDNDIPADVTAAELDSSFSAVNAGSIIDIPTAVGFCMYIRRDCLEEIGLFDESAFGKGYGEENDFSMRALRHGWRNVLACDTFIWHKGNVSFGDSHNERKRSAIRTLSRLHPEYDFLVQKYIQTDPARPFRCKVDFHRLSHDQRQRVLFITHSRGGGTEKHIRELALHLKEQLHCIVLRPDTGHQVVVEGLEDETDWRLWFRLPEDYKSLLNVLEGFGLARVHVHHTLGVPPRTFGLLEDLHLPWDFTTHDYYPLCPQITLTAINNRYCGEQGDDQCRSCLKQQPAPGNVDIITWRNNHRALIESAERVFAPCHDAAVRYKRHFPAASIKVQPHPDCESQPPFPAPKPLERRQEPLRIAVLGALSQIKGADMLEHTARIAKINNLPLQFRLFGFAYRHLSALGTLSTSGAYHDDDLPDLLTAWRPDIVWFPAQWPETYSYTMSAVLAMGLPIVATDLGAQAERIAGRPASWLMPWNSGAEEWNEFFLALHDGETPPTKPRSAPLQPLENYAADYLQGHYAPPGMIRLPEYWTDFLSPRLSAHQSLKAHAGRFLVSSLAYLRNQPLLSWLAQQIPPSLQRRIKSYLLE